jgi:hypothetical protein
MIVGNNRFISENLPTLKIITPVDVFYFDREANTEHERLDKLLYGISVDNNAM